MKNDAYDDIIHLPHHVSPTRPRMTIENRAAQFSPFQALTGYEDAVKEAGRLTDRRIELDESATEVLDLKLALLAERLTDRPEMVITHFVSDEKKAGGAYVSTIGAVKKIDAIERIVLLMTGERIAISDILDIEGELFKDLL